MTDQEAVEAFFRAYRGHDIAAMVQSFAPEGEVEYVPIGLQGAAAEAGLGIWETLIGAFPDLSNEVTALYVDPLQDTVIAEVVIRGTQAHEVFGIPDRHRTFSLPHVFIIRLDAERKFKSMKAYWDNVQLFKQLGQNTLV